MYPYDVAFELITKAIQEGLRREQSGEVTAEELDQTETLKKALADKQKRRRKIQEGFESDLYNATEAGRLLKELDRETEKIDEQIERIQREKQNRTTAKDTISRMDDIENVPIWLQHGDPVRINRLLSAWLLEIRLANGEVVKLVKR